MLFCHHLLTKPCQGFLTKKQLSLSGDSMLWNLKIKKENWEKFSA
jgi:hypothetical protein